MNMIKKNLSKKSFLGAAAALVGAPNNTYWFKFIVTFKLFHLSIFWKFTIAIASCKLVGPKYLGFFCFIYEYV
jgi:hypothetical protein